MPIFHATTPMAPQLATSAAVSAMRRNDSRFM
jgi:hypothetical protein